MEKFTVAAGCATRISDTGSKDACTVVLLHGYLESLDVWDEVTSLLSGDLRVISLDLPGHGISEVKDDTHTMAFLADVVSGVLENEGVGRAVVVGHSMGGYVALEFLRRHTDKCSGVVLLHSHPFADTDKKREDRQREISLIEGGKKELIARTAPQAVFAPQNKDRLAAEMDDMTERIVLTEEEGIVAVLRGMGSRDDLTDMMRKSPVPQLLIFGRHDQYLTSEVADEVIRLEPQAQVVWLENSGHMGQTEEPSATASAILDFCREACGE